MKNKMLIKVCGMRQPDNIREVEALHIHLMGFIFYPHSPRFVKAKPAYLPEKVKRVGVFVNAPFDEIRKKATEYSLDYLQLHGNETPEECSVLQEEGYHIIKAFSIATAEDVSNTTDYDDTCDYFLFDTKSEKFGGAGKTFEWNLLQHYSGITPFLLSGGIGPESIASLNDFAHPLWAGIDLNSQFETAPGVKEPKMIAEFLKAACPDLLASP